MRTKLFKLTGTAAVLCILASGCKVDDRYSSDNLKDINTDVTLFENGLEIPLIQSTAQFRVDSLLKKTGVDTTDFGKYLKVDQAGNYYIEFSDAVILDESIKSIGLEKIASVDGVSFSQDFNYEVEPIDAGKVRVESKSFGKDITFDDYSFTISIDPVSKEQTILSKSAINTAGAAAAALGQSEVSFDLPAQSVSIDNATIPAVTLPEMFTKINSISLGSDARIRIKVSVPGCILTAGTITPDIKVDLSDIFTFAGSGIIDLSALTLSAANSFQAQHDYAITGVNAAKLTQSKTVSMSGTYSIAGGKTSAGVAAAASSDLMLNVEVSFIGLSVSDYSADVKGHTFDITVAEESIDIDAGTEIADYGTFVVTPKGSPALGINLNLPEDLSGLNLSVGSGITIKLPDIIKFKNVPAELNYNATANTIVLSQIGKASYSLPIDCMVITPNKEGKISSKYSVDGAISLVEGTITKSAIDKISGKTVSVEALIPTIEVGTISLDELSFDVDQKEEVVFIKEGTLPDMIKSVSEIVLDQVKAEIEFGLTGLPDLNGGTYNVDITATLPDFVKPHQIQFKGVVQNGKPLKQTIDLTGIDLTGVDLTKEIKGEVSVVGKLYAEKPSVSVENLGGKISGSFNATVAGPEGKIALKSVSAKVGYQIDTTISGVNITLPDFLKDVNFDLPKANIIADITANIGIPVDASIAIGDDVKSIEFPYSANPADSKTAHNEIQIDINEILKAEKLDIGMSLKVDETKNCYIEPSAAYTARVDYSINAPLQLGSDFNFVYADTVAIGSNSDVIAEVLQKSSVAIKGDIENTLPFAVSVLMEPLSYDSATDTYTILKLEVPATTGLVKAGDKTEFKVELNAAKDTDYTKLSHVRLSVDLSSNGAALKEGDFIQITNLTAVLPEGVTIDPKKLSNNE